MSHPPLAELSAIPFSTLLKAKKKLARSSAPSSGSEDDSEDDDVGNGGTRFGKDGAVLKGKKAQTTRKNGSLCKADRASKHASVPFAYRLMATLAEIT